MMRRSAFLAGVAALAVSGRALAQFSRQLTIAVSVPLSGPLGRFGDQVLAGAQGAIDYVNRFLAPVDTVFGLRSFDDQASAGLATTVAQLAAADPSIVAAIGSLTADATIAILPQYANAGMPLIVPATTRDRVTQEGFRNVFRLPTKDSIEGQLLANAIVTGAKPAYAIALTPEGSYGPDVARAFAQQMSAAGHRAEVVTLPASPTSGTIRDLLAKRPDHIALCGNTDQLGSAASMLRSGGFTGSFSAGDGFYNEQTPVSYGKVLGDALIASSMPPLSRAPATMPFTLDYQRRYGAITAFAAYGYAAAQIIIAAARRGMATTRFALLSAMQFGGGSYDTIVGPFTFDPFGDPLNPNVYFYRIDGTGFAYVKAARPTGFVL
jgi:branched-chain amino acid transport system substrate-binding protein